MKGFLAHLLSLRMKPHTIGAHELYLYRFLCFLQEQKISDIQTIQQSHILVYISGMDTRYTSIVHGSLAVIRRFLKYLYEQQILHTDLSLIIPKDNYKKQAKLPSTYTQVEIEQMIAGPRKYRWKTQLCYCATCSPTRTKGIRHCWSSVCESALGRKHYHIKPV